MLLNSPDCPKLIEIDENYIAANDIVGVVSAVQVEDMEKRRRGMWQCKHGNWQDKNESTCKCVWGETTKEKEETKEERTPQAMERGKLIIQLLRKRIHPKNISDLSNEDLKKMLK